MKRRVLTIRWRLRYDLGRIGEDRVVSQANGLNIKEVVWEEKKPYLCDSQNIDSWNEKEK